MEQVSYSPWVVTFMCCLIAYAVCGVPFGKIIAKAMCGTDLQKVGSGNIGTTNALRAGGPKVAACTLLLDVLKGVICVTGSRSAIAGICFAGQEGLLAPGGAFDYLTAIVALACVIGHMFSPYLHFKGGKSIAVGVGVLFAIFVPWALAQLGVFIVLVALTRYVSVGSIATAALVGPIAALMFPQASLTFKLIMAVLGLLVVWAHRGNIKKLLRGTESKLSFTKRVDKMDE